MDTITKYVKEEGITKIIYNMKNEMEIYEKYYIPSKHYDIVYKLLRKYEVKFNNPKIYSLKHCYSRSGFGQQLNKSNINKLRIIAHSQSEALLKLFKYIWENFNEDFFKDIHDDLIETFFESYYENKDMNEEVDEKYAYRTEIKESKNEISGVRSLKYN